MKMKKNFANDESINLTEKCIDTNPKFQNYEVLKTIEQEIANEIDTCYLDEGEFILGDIENNSFQSQLDTSLFIFVPIDFDEINDGQENYNEIPQQDPISDLINTSTKDDSQKEPEPFTFAALEERCQINNNKNKPKRFNELTAKLRKVRKQKIQTNSGVNNCELEEHKEQKLLRYNLRLRRLKRQSQNASQENNFKTLEKSLNENESTKVTINLNNVKRNSRILKDSYEYNEKQIGAKKKTIDKQELEKFERHLTEFKEEIRKSKEINRNNAFKENHLDIKPESDLFLMKRNKKDNKMNKKSLASCRRKRTMVGDLTVSEYRRLYREKIKRMKGEEFLAAERERAAIYRQKKKQKLMEEKLLNPNFEQKKEKKKSRPIVDPVKREKYLEVRKQWREKMKNSKDFDFMEYERQRVKFYRRRLKFIQQQSKIQEDSDLN